MLQMNKHYKSDFPNKNPPTSRSLDMYSACESAIIWTRARARTRTRTTAVTHAHACAQRHGEIECVTGGTHIEMNKINFTRTNIVIHMPFGNEIRICQQIKLFYSIRFESFAFKLLRTPQLSGKCNGIAVVRETERKRVCFQDTFVWTCLPLEVPLPVCLHDNFWTRISDRHKNSWSFQEL